VPANQADLFGAPQTLPDGFSYQLDFLDDAEERALLAVIGALPFTQAQYKEWTAKRRIVSYGGRYDFNQGELLPAGPVPEFLLPLRARLAQWLELPAADFTHALIAEYRPGTPLGWHRDVPEFEAIAGVSLLGTARMRLRGYPPRPGQRAALKLDLAPRSAYALVGPARWRWQHAISPTKELRYSITFRTLRARGTPPLG
jgi:alkylated DNA repair dioxygenase AlkB